MICYRVQHKDTKLGCYTHFMAIYNPDIDNIPDWQVEMIGLHNENLDDWPTPGISCDYDMHQDDRSAFRSLEDLYAWFSDFLPDILKYGFEVVKVKGKFIVGDSKQVVVKDIKTLGVIENIFDLIVSTEVEQNA